MKVALPIFNFLLWIGVFYILIEQEVTYQTSKFIPAMIVVAGSVTLLSIAYMGWERYLHARFGDSNAEKQPSNAGSDLETRLKNVEQIVDSKPYDYISEKQRLNLILEILKEVDPEVKIPEKEITVKQYVMAEAVEMIVKLLPADSAANTK